MNLSNEKTRRIAFIALALLFAGLAASAQARRDRQLRDFYGADAQTTLVLVAARDLEMGQSLMTEDLKVEEVPVRWRHPMTVDESDHEQVVGLTLSQPLVAHQPLLWSDLDTTTADGLLSTSVQGGLRAVSVPVKQADAMGGLLRPGDAVDVLATYDKPGIGQVTTTLLQDVLVLATGRALHPGQEDDGFRNITVQVTPHEAELLFFARRRAQLGLTLRNPADRDAVEDLPEVVFKDMAGADAVPQVRRENRPTILRAPRR